MRFLRKYGKAIAALAVAGLTGVASALTDNAFTAPEGVQVAIAVATAAGVWLVPTLPQHPGTKTALAALLAVLNLAVTLITDGLTGAEIVNLALAALGVLGVGVAPTRSVGAYLTGPPRTE